MPSDRSSRLRIALIASEAVPYAKTGGLADVAGALPRALASLGHDVLLFIPRYGTIASSDLKEWRRLSVPSVVGPIDAVVEQEVLVPGSPDTGRARVMAIRHDPYFDRAGLYQERGIDYPDNLDRFTFFCRAVMEVLRALESEDWVPDILHAHDWQAALCLVFGKILYADYIRRRAIASVFTVHNLGYQGLFPGAAFPRTGLPSSVFTPTTLEFYGSCNLLKGGLIFGDLLSTVSRTYGEEIQTPEYGFGLDGVIRDRRDRMTGVVNGIDVDVWDPSRDRHLPAHYSIADLRGKQACKTALQREMDLPPHDVPLLGVISRLTSQKGLDLLAAILPDVMALDVQLVMLGTGDPALEEEFRSWQTRYPKKIGIRLAFDEGLAHRIEAGADMFLMPSRYEPCGLNQLYSLRYGTVPIVRRTGGLADTVVPYSPTAIAEGRATGFMFRSPAPDSLLMATLLALQVYRDRDQWARLIQAGMRTDVSWEASARAYVRLFREARQYVGVPDGEKDSERKG